MFLWNDLQILSKNELLYYGRAGIDHNDTLKKEFYTSRSRKVLVHLAECVLVDGNSQHWRNDYGSCSTSGWIIIRKILNTGTNCILANKVLKIDSEITSTGKKHFRKIRKIIFLSTVPLHLYCVFTNPVVFY